MQRHNGPGGTAADDRAGPGMAPGRQSASQPPHAGSKSARSPLDGHEMAEEHGLQLRVTGESPGDPGDLQPNGAGSV